MDKARIIMIMYGREWRNGAMGGEGNYIVRKITREIYSYDDARELEGVGWV